MYHLEGSGTPVLYIWDARFLKVKPTMTDNNVHYIKRGRNM